MGTTDGYVGSLELLPPGSDLPKKFNLVFVSEGYPPTSTSTSLPQFREHVQGVLSQLETTPAFVAHARWLNVLLLHVVSAEAGADRGTDQARTYFDARFPGTFPGSLLPPQLLLVDEVLVRETVADALAKYAQQQEKLALPHKIIVLVNTPYDGGSGGNGDGIAVASTAIRVRTALHELGHTFGLVDEYPSGGGTGPNLSTEVSPLPTWWEGLVSGETPRPTHAGPSIGFHTVGVFEDLELSPTHYRSQWLCRMRTSVHDAFCRVCSTCIQARLQPPTL